MFVYFTMSIVFARPPFNLFYNGLLILFFFSSLLLALKRNIPVLRDAFIVFWTFSVLYILISFLISKAFSITPLANVLAILSGYLFFKSCDKEEKENSGLFLYFGLVILLLAACIRYVPHIKDSKNVVLLMNDGYFFNLDGLTDLLAINFGLSLFYVRKKNVLPALFMIPSAFLCIISMRRAALILIAIAILTFIYSFFKKGNKKYFLFVIFIFLMILIILLSLPFMQSVAFRIGQTILTLFGAAEETSMINRMLMILRGYFKGVVSPESFYGFNNIIDVAAQTNHDTFGDMVFNFGGLFATAVACLMLIQIFYSIRANKKDPYLLKFSGYSMLILFFITAIFNNREMCFFFGILSAININSYVKEAVVIPKKKRYQSISI